MKKREIIRNILVVCLTLVFVASCKYDDVLPIEPDPGVQISFSSDIIPIFNASCNLAGCHTSSGHVPDLSPVAAYNALWDGMYIDTMLPEDSELYLWMLGVRGLPMPLEGVNASYVSTTLQWIRQGAPNN